VAAPVGGMAKRSNRPTMIQDSRRKSPEEKALYHQELGAGKSHVKRPFLGLTTEDEEAIVTRLSQGFDKRIDTV
jgi:phage gpG-like protein